MDRLPKILFLPWTLVLSFCIAEKSEADSIHSDAYEHQHHSHTHSSSVYPENGPGLYCIQRQGRSTVSLIRIPPVPGAKDNPRDYSAAGLQFEYAIQKPAASYIVSSRDINLSLTVRELLFPYHSFL